MLSRILIVCNVLFSFTCLSQGTIDPYLTSKITASNQSSSFECLVFFRERANLQELASRFYSENTPIHERAYDVLHSLKEASNSVQSNLVDFVIAWNLSHPADKA